MSAARSPFRVPLWLLLAIPAGLMTARAASGETLPMDLLHPTGELAIRLMLLAMLVGPLIDIFGPNRFFRAWRGARRQLGVAAFCYGALHLVFYAIDMRSLAAIVDEFTLPAIWTGWLSFALMLAAASISTDAAMRALGRNWKRIQRGVYAAFLVGLVHWLLLDWEWVPAAIHLAPLMIVWTGRIVVRRRPLSRKERPA